MLFLVLLVGTTSVLRYLTAYWQKHPVPKCPVKSVVLGANATFLFRHEHRVYRDTYYLDRASAVLAGLVSYRSGHTMYVLDVKAWQVFTVPLSNTNISNDDLATIEMRQYSLPLINEDTNILDL